MAGIDPRYVEVSVRWARFRERFPDAYMTSEIVPSPADGFIVVKAYVYTSKEDERPSTGLAWEPVPGKTPFTRDSELMNAETSAWGRALVAHGEHAKDEEIASANEVRLREHSDVVTKREFNDIKRDWFKDRKDELEGMDTKEAWGKFCASCGITVDYFDHTKWTPDDLVAAQKGLKEDVE